MPGGLGCAPAVLFCLQQTQCTVPRPCWVEVTLRVPPPPGPHFPVSIWASLPHVFSDPGGHRRVEKGFSPPRLCLAERTLSPPQLGQVLGVCEVQGLLIAEPETIHPQRQGRSPALSPRTSRWS